MNQVLKAHYNKQLHHLPALDNAAENLCEINFDSAKYSKSVTHIIDPNFHAFIHRERREICVDCLLKFIENAMYENSSVDYLKRLADKIKAS